MIVLTVIQYCKVICRLSWLSENLDCQLPTQESNPEPKFQSILNEFGFFFNNFADRASQYNLTN